MGDMGGWAELHVLAFREALWGGGRVRSSNHCYLGRGLLSVLFSEAFLVTALGNQINQFW